MVTKNNHWKIKGHTLIKHRIVGGYINACAIFDKRYHNAAYIDTHGGSGKVLNLTDGILIDGSPLLASKIGMCHIIEANKKRVNLLRRYTQNYENITIHNGDCNDLIFDVLETIPQQKFIFCLIDPNGFVFKKGKETKMQLRAETIDAIAKHPRTEMLLNFMVSGCLRIIPWILEKKIDDYVTPLFGTEKWKEKWETLQNNEFKRYDTFKNLLIDERLRDYYDFIEWIPINAKNGVPIYYLIYATNNKIGYKIMQNIFEKEKKIIPISSTIKDNIKMNYHLDNWGI